MKTLKDLFLAELADMYDAEHRILKALPKLAKAATCEKLKGAFLSHLEETKGQVTKLQSVFRAFGAGPKRQKCQATVGLLEEGDELAAENQGEITINAALICAAQKVEHYEIASYGCLHEWAGLLENKKAGVLLKHILDQEKAANESLLMLACISCNHEALGECGECNEGASGKRPASLRRGIRPVKLGRQRSSTLV
jgi:ferritin-like metal-binding protein YciE